MGFEQFESFEGDYQPKTGFAPDVKTIPPGRMHEFEFVRAELKRAAGKDLCSAVVRCLTPEFAGEYQLDWWFNQQISMDLFGGDMLKLGFDSDKWGASKGRPLSVEVPRVVSRLPGVRFRAMNTTRKGSDSKEYFDFRIYGRTNAPPAKGNAARAATSTAPQSGEDPIPY